MMTQPSKSIFTILFVTTITSCRNNLIKKEINDKLVYIDKTCVPKET